VAAASVFINCPYDRAYQPRFWALVFAVLDAGFRPRAALEVSNAAKGRLEKILGIIRESRYSIHDLCRADAPRFNMPFEAGLAIGHAHGLASEHASILILATNKQRFERSASDLKGVDPVYYRGKPAAAVTRWLQQFFDPTQIFPGPTLIAARFRQFWRRLPAFAERAGFDHRDPSWIEMQSAVLSYLKEHPLRAIRSRGKRGSGRR
jgi:hypothetical protein